MNKSRIFGLIFLITGILLGYFIYASEANDQSKYGFRLGLDLSGGTHLIYEANTTDVVKGEINSTMSALRDVIERRVNLFGVSEPVVQVEKPGAFSSSNRLIVELPGVTDVDEAVALIGKTPLLEFKLFDSDAQKAFVEQVQNNSVTEGFNPQTDLYTDTGLTGRLLKRATLQFGSNSSGGLSNEPIIGIEFDREGADLFAKLTRENVGEVMAIFLDGVLISDPVIREEITGGQAVISGNFTPDEARELVRDLNFGALPIPIELISTQNIGASLGEEALNSGLVAAIYGLIVVALFLILWYRLPGLVAVLSLGIYIVLILTLFKIIPVTLTAAGIAGFILSIGMAVDANILIFERIRDEFNHGERNIKEAVTRGFNRAWLPIRDGNISSILTAVILFWFGTSLVEGFALVFGLGVIVSMFTAITITRNLLLSISSGEYSGKAKFLFGNGFK
ncbi:protein translocase subunit SecD [Candidatus Wolfebacteria bacterium]|nr:MAG: protein translocase subunit SecD [Candidatus Wolfebacteria bacterium]